MNGNNVDLLVKMNLGDTNGGKIDIKDMDVNIDFSTIYYSNFDSYPGSYTDH